MTAWILLPEMPDPDLKEGDVLTLERADGVRSVWRCRMYCTGVFPSADPTDSIIGYEMAVSTEN